MSAIIFFQDVQVSVPLWGLGLSALFGFGGIFFGANQMIRASKKDVTDNIHTVKVELKEDILRVDNKKVDMKLFEETCTSIESKAKINQGHVNTRFDNVEKKIDSVSTDIKTLIKLHLKDKS